MSKYFGGLKPLPQDQRDIKFGAIFKPLDLSKLPYRWIVKEPLTIKDQMETDFCTACASTAVSEDQELIIFSPEWQFAVAKQGDLGWGCDLRQMAHSLIKYGSLPMDYSPYAFGERTRDFMADYANWQPELERVAKPYRKKSYAFIDPYIGTDLFDTIRIVLYKGKSVFTGALWRDSWTYAAGGLIPKEYEANGFGHAFKIMGYDGGNLILQLSNGTDIGDKGLFYMPREVANKELTFGCVTFTDIDKDELDYRQRYHKIIAKLLALLKKLSKLL